MQRMNFCPNRLECTQLGEFAMIKCLPKALIRGLREHLGLINNRQTSSILKVNSRFSDHINFR